jgi:hypothetical protein
MIQFRSFEQRLTDEIQKVEAAILDLWRKSGIEEFRNDPNSAVLFIVHPYYWKALPIEHRAQQAKLLGQYRHWYELFYRCHAQHSSDMQDKIAETNTYILEAVELKSGWGTAATFEANRSLLSEKTALFRNLLEQHVREEPEFVLVPDTNALLKSADPAHYREVIDSARFRFVIVPTVLAELDGLKRSRGGQTLGEKAEKAIRVIKGLRKQGSVLEGVTVAKTITVQMIPTEPRMADLPSWLDPDNQDDRIIGSLLEIQCAEPSAVVVLVTDDMNLQNKAEMVYLPWAEPPEFAPKPVAVPAT